jgi:hypothetical protein
MGACKCLCKQYLCISNESRLPRPTPSGAGGKGSCQDMAAAAAAAPHAQLPAAVLVHCAAAAGAPHGGAGCCGREQHARPAVPRPGGPALGLPARLCQLPGRPTRGIQVSLLPDSPVSRVGVSRNDRTAVAESCGRRCYHVGGISRMKQTHHDRSSIRVLKSHGDDEGLRHSQNMAHSSCHAWRLMMQTFVVEIPACTRM